MKTQRQFCYLLALVSLTGTGLAHADPGDTGYQRDRYLDQMGDRIERRLDRKGERIDRRLDYSGDAADARLDRAADHAAAQGHDALARTLDNRGDRIRHPGGTS